jgi:hypothetical protein
MSKKTPPTYPTIVQVMKITNTAIETGVVVSRATVRDIATDRRKTAKLR